jgi:misacylated tRNA(Ala) deacylase
MAYDLSCGTSPEDVVAAVDKVKTDRAELRRKEVKLLKDVAKFEGARMEAEMMGGKSAWLWRADEGMEFLNFVLFELKQAIKGSEGVVAVLAVGDKGKPGQVVVVGSAAAVEELVGKIQAAEIGVKGNGKGERWQGKVLEWKKGELERLEKLAVEPLG